jgi:hypothetical protein
MAELMSARDRVRAPNVRLTDQQFAVIEQYRKSQKPQQAKAPQLEGLGPPVPPQAKPEQSKDRKEQNRIRRAERVGSQACLDCGIVDAELSAATLRPTRLSQNGSEEGCKPAFLLCCTTCPARLCDVCAVNIRGGASTGQVTATEEGRRLGHDDLLVVSWQCRACVCAAAAAAHAQSKADAAQKKRAAEDDMMRAAKRLNRFEDGLLRDRAFSGFHFGANGAPLQTAQLVSIFETTTFERMGRNLFRMMYKGQKREVDVEDKLPLWAWRSGRAKWLYSSEDGPGGDIKETGGEGAKGNSILYKIKPKASDSTQLQDYDFIFNTNDKEAASWRKGRRCYSRQQCCGKMCQHKIFVEQIPLIVYDAATETVTVTVRLNQGSM